MSSFYMSLFGFIVAKKVSAEMSNRIANTKVNSFGSFKKRIGSLKMMKKAYIKVNAKT